MKEGDWYQLWAQITEEDKRQVDRAWRRFFSKRGMYRDVCRGYGDYRRRNLKVLKGRSHRTTKLQREIKDENDQNYIKEVISEQGTDGPKQLRIIDGEN